MRHQGQFADARVPLEVDLELAALAAPLAGSHRSVAKPTLGATRAALELARFLGPVSGVDDEAGGSVAPI
jgi:hypothetical protein